jgi:hypothetical protein
MNCSGCLIFWIVIGLVGVGCIAILLWPRKNNKAIDRAAEVLSTRSNLPCRTSLNDLMSPKMKERMKDKPPQTAESTGLSHEEYIVAESYSATMKARKEEQQRLSGDVISVVPTPLPLDSK